MVPSAVLVTRLRYLGDVILTTPMLRQLRVALPEAKIGYLVEEAFAPALEGCPDLDRLHVLPTSSSWSNTLRVVRELRSEHYDWAIDLFGNPRSAVLCALSGAGARVGSKRGLRSRLYQHRRGRPAGDPSAVLHHLDKLVPLLDSCGLPAPSDPPPPTRLWLSSEQRAAGERQMAQYGDGPWAFLNPGSKWPDKAWPLEGWMELARMLVADSELSIAVIRPPGESALAESLAAAHDRIHLLPALGLRQLWSVISQATLYVGNDGGILHAAVALGVATLGLFGPTEPEIWFPYEDLGPYRVLHSCSKAPDRSGSLLHDLSAQRVHAACRALIEESRN